MAKFDRMNIVNRIGGLTLGFKRSILSRIVYRYYHLASFGALAFDWNADHCLTSIQLLPTGHEGVKVVQDIQKTPHFIHNLVLDLCRYFESGEPLVNIPWDQMHWGTLSPFQQEVLKAVTKIPHGQTRTYAWVGMKIGKPRALRAVGQALRRNPFPILIPCHRIVGSSGALVGFMGEKEDATKAGGSAALNLKSFLINTEHQYLNPVFSFLA